MSRINETKIYNSKLYKQNYVLLINHKKATGSTKNKQYSLYIYYITKNYCY